MKCSSCTCSCEHISDSSKYQDHNYSFLPNNDLQWLKELTIVNKITNCSQWKICAWIDNSNYIFINSHRYHAENGILSKIKLHNRKFLKINIVRYRYNHGKIELSSYPYLVFIVGYFYKSFQLSL